MKTYLPSLILPFLALGCATASKTDGPIKIENIVEFSRKDLQSAKSMVVKKEPSERLLTSGTRVNCRGKICDLTFKPKTIFARSNDKRVGVINLEKMDVKLTDSEINEIIGLMDLSKNQKLDVLDKNRVLHCGQDKCSLNFEIPNKLSFESQGSPGFGGFMIQALVSGATQRALTH